ncbi:MAG TPA: hypothetical protein VMH28_12480 [Candidatus Acidoferrales bacterium]|nr:hypothetical protein [Candidatus Acidoferrales bacterium]
MRDRAKTLGCAAVLFALNAYVTLRLFHTDYTRHMGSIEAAYIGLARYVSRHWNDLGWFPLWYGGIPYPDTYPPLLHWLCALAITVTGISPGMAHHFVTAALYSVGPAALFWMAWRLCGDRACALAAGLGYSLLSPTCFLVKEVRSDAGGYFAARRLDTLVVYGEGPHIASMCLLPIAIGMLHLALTKRKPWYWAGAAMSIAAVPMCNWLGGMALAMGISAYLLAGLPEKGRALPNWIRTAGLGVWAYALVVPWLSPSTIDVVRANAPRVAHGFTSDVVQKVFVASVAACFLAMAWLLARARLPRHTRFAGLFLFVTAASALGRYWLGVSLVPQPERYHLEMDMAFWVTAAFAIWTLARRLPRKASLAAAATAAAVCIPIVIHQRRWAREQEEPIDIRTTIEYKTAAWLDAHLPGGRVFAPGTIGFWLNAFSDTPQLTGGFDNGILNPMLPHVIYQIYAGEKQQLAIEWLQAYGCDAMIGGGSDSAEVYHPIKHPEKLLGLRELWRDGGDAIYDVPRRTRSLAHAMGPGELVQVEPMAYESKAIVAYLAALENPAYPPAEFRWRSPSAATIDANLEPGHILSVQISWDEGWKASSGGRPVPVRGDKLGQVVIEPGCNGRCTVELNYDGGAEARWASAISMAAFGGGAAWVLVGVLWRRRSDSVRTN